jgi:hypothetical protein
MPDAGTRLPVAGRTDCGAAMNQHVLVKPAIAGRSGRTPKHIYVYGQCVGIIRPIPNPVGIVGDETRWQADHINGNRIYGTSSEDAAIKWLLIEEGS